MTLLHLILYAECVTSYHKDMPTQNTRWMKILWACNVKDVGSIKNGKMKGFSDMVSLSLVYVWQVCTSLWCRRSRGACTLGRKGLCCSAASATSQDYMCKIVQTVQPSAASKCIRPQAVFGNVLDKEEVQVATDLFWKYMELSTNSVRRDNPLTSLGV